ncbi:MAG: LacI family DNA-binding transcriptional regulator [Clostridia bacterium]|nr:LacI family DNA-binding transcriptional regulator [Clostridia bacterium]
MTPNRTRNVVTLRDIAEACHVSINTVSHALSDKADISEETKRRIRKKAKELGYIRNRTATSLRFQSTHTVTLIVSDISNPLFAIMAKKIEQRLSQEGYALFIMNTESNAEAEYAAVVSAIENAADGIIICPNQEDTRAMELMQKRQVPFVLLGRRFIDSDMDYVIWNDRQGGHQATNHLVGKGHRRILFVGEAPHISSTNERLEGYRLALEEHGLPFDPSLVYTKGVAKEKLEAMLRTQLNQPDPFTAIFAFSDFVACDLLAILYKLNPHHRIEVVGFDDIMTNIAFPLNISSVHTPKAAMAAALVDSLLDKIRNGDEANPCRIVIDTTLTVR